MDNNYGTRAKSQIGSMELQGNETYCTCEIVWHDNESEETVTIKLDCGVEEDEDDDIFFYVKGIRELLGLTDWDNGEDFTINDIIEIY
jgi:hypothetical protein